MEDEGGAMKEEQLRGGQETTPDPLVPKRLPTPLCHPFGAEPLRRSGSAGASPSRIRVPNCLERYLVICSG